MSLDVPATAAPARCPRCGLTLVRVLDGRRVCVCCDIIAGCPCTHPAAP